MGVPPNMRLSYIAELRSLLNEEKQLQQQRRDHFFGQHFEVGNAGACFPAAWTNFFELTQQGIEAGDVQQAALDEETVNSMLKSVPCFDKMTEDGSRFRIYQQDGFEIRSLQQLGGKEHVGVTFARCAQEAASNEIADSCEKIVKATEYVEAPRHYYVVLETEQGQRIMIERKQESSTVAWAANPKYLEARNSKAKVLRSAECAGESITLRDLKDHIKADDAVCVSKRHAHECFRRTVGV